MDLGNGLQLDKASAGAARDQLGVERHWPVTLPVRSGDDIGLKMRQRMLTGKLIAERYPPRILAFRAVHPFSSLEQLPHRKPPKLSSPLYSANSGRNG